MPDFGLADLRRRLLSLISCFAGGVFLATCLLDLLPDYLQGINEAFSNTGIIVRSDFWLFFLIHIQHHKHVGSLSHMSN